MNAQPWLRINVSRDRIALIMLAISRVFRGLTGPLWPAAPPEFPSDEALLGRPAAAPDPDLMARTITGKVVMVTGAGGSIGSELCRQILPLRPKAIVLLDHSEFALYRCHHELSIARAEVSTPPTLIPVLGSVTDPRLVDRTLASAGVQTIYHAAAYKHVPLLETNIAVGVENNVFGTNVVTRAALKAGVGSFVLISSDKAVRPSSVMGASKRLSELICQSLAASRSITRFSIVRFGNVLGSSGSVLPLFADQIRRGGPVTVTTPHVTRYFMTAREAAQLVLQAGALATGGEVFSLKMGPPLGILDLAGRLIRSQGKTPSIGGDARSPRPQRSIEIAITGLRPGEKEREDLLLGTGHLHTTHPSIHYSWEPCLGAIEIDLQLGALRRAIDSGDDVAVKAVLLAAPIGYAGSGLASETGSPPHADSQRMSLAG